MLRGNNFIIAGKINLLLHFDNKIGYPLSRKICGPACMHEAGGLERVSGAFPLCLDQFL